MMAGTKLVVVLEFDLDSNDDMEPMMSIAMEALQDLRSVTSSPFLSPAYVAINESADKVLEVFK